MKGPVLGFRAWRLPKPPRQGPFEVSVIRRFVADPEADLWLDEHLRKPAPQKPPRVVLEPGTLLPLNPGPRPGPWSRPGPVCFFCNEKRHQRPTWDCECGLYAWLSVDGLAGKYAWGDVVGAVIAWGHIIVHGTEGFRAEWMRVVALSPNREGPPVVQNSRALQQAKLAAERLGVPCVPLSRLEEVGREFGNPIRWEYRFE